jgi:DNA processing protein
LDLGRDIYVVPGSVENPMCSGSNALLKEGARVLSDPAAVLEEMADLDLGLDADGAPRSGTPNPAGSVPSNLKGLWEVVSVEPVPVEDLARRAAIPLREALAGLSALELGGWVRQCPGMRFRRS